MFFDGQKIKFSSRGCKAMKGKLTRYAGGTFCLCFMRLMGEMGEDGESGRWRERAMLHDDAK